MSDDRIDRNAISRDQRDNLMRTLGRIEANQDQATVDRSRVEKKVDDLGGNIIKTHGALEVYVVQDNAAHEKLLAQITAMNLLLAGDQNQRGIMARLNSLEMAHAKLRSMIIGGLAVASAVASIVGTLLQIVAKKIGLGT